MYGPAKIQKNETHSYIVRRVLRDATVSMGEAADRQSSEAWKCNIHTRWVRTYRFIFVQPQSFFSTACRDIHSKYFKSGAKSHIIIVSNRAHIISYLTVSWQSRLRNRDEIFITRMRVWALSEIRVFLSTGPNCLIQELQPGLFKNLIN